MHVFDRIIAVVIVAASLLAAVLLVGAGPQTGMGGDVTGPPSNCRVTGIQGYSFSNTAPSADYVPTWNANSNSYEPAAVAGSLQLGLNGAAASSVTTVELRGVQSSSVGTTAYVTCPPSSVSGGRVSLSSTTLYYLPEVSNTVYCYDSTTAAWLPKVIPAAGISVSGASLSASTLYYIYVYDNSGTLTLEITTTAYTTQDNIQVKNGATGRTLVALAYTHTDGAVKWSATQRFIANIYRPRYYSSALTTSGVHTYALSAWQLWNTTTDKVEFVTVAQENAIIYGCSGDIGNDAASTGRIGVGVDSTTTPSIYVDWGIKSTTYTPARAQSLGVAEGYHYCCPFEQSVSGAGTVSLSSITYYVFSAH